MATSRSGVTSASNLQPLVPPPSAQDGDTHVSSAVPRRAAPTAAGARSHAVGPSVRVLDANGWYSRQPARAVASPAPPSKRRRRQEQASGARRGREEEGLHNERPHRPRIDVHAWGGDQSQSQVTCRK